jgi:hypothetical protein
MAHIIDIFLQPSKVFTEHEQKPGFVVPLAIVALLTAGVTLFYFLKVDPSWYVDHALLASGREMSPGDIENARRMMPGARTMGLVGAPMGVLMLCIVSAIYALYFMLAGKVTGVPVSFRHGMSLTSWSNMPVLLGLLVALVGVVSMSPQTGFESLMLTNFDPLFVQLPAGSPWASLARNFNLLNLWVTFLMAVGWHTWSKRGWAEAIVVASIPFFVVYGGMALFAIASQ